MTPAWTVTLVCGASGVGKSRFATALAARYATPLAPADDVVTALKAMTTADQEPVLHYWDTHPEAWSWPVERIADLHLSVSQALLPGLRAVVADHVESAAPVVLEGDYLLPELADGFGGAVRAVLLAETDAERIVANYRSREPDGGDQSYRARVGVEVTALLAERFRKAGAPVVAARPWADAVDRADAALRATSWSA
jgi:2-phosphoglycerate kinase